MVPMDTTLRTSELEAYFSTKLKLELKRSIGQIVIMI